MPEPNNPGYRPEYKELEEARKDAELCRQAVKGARDPARTLVSALAALTAEVRVVRLERALER